MKPSLHMDSLCLDTLRQLFAFLRVSDRVRCREVCREWNECVGDFSIYRRAHALLQTTRTRTPVRCLCNCSQPPMGLSVAFCIRYANIPYCEIHFMQHTDTFCVPGAITYMKGPTPIKLLRHANGLVTKETCGYSPSGCATTQLTTLFGSGT